MPFTQVEQKGPPLCPSWRPALSFSSCPECSSSPPRGELWACTLSPQFCLFQKLYKFCTEPTSKTFSASNGPSTHTKLHKVNTNPATAITFLNSKTLGHLNTDRQSPASQEQNQYGNTGFGTRKAEAGGQPEIGASEFRVSLGYSDLVLKRGKQKTKDKNRTQACS